MLAPRFKTCRQISENVWQIKKLTQKQIQFSTVISMFKLLCEFVVVSKHD
jgi:hypothetical protein